MRRLLPLLLAAALVAACSRQSQPEAPIQAPPQSSAQATQASEPPQPAPGEDTAAASLFPEKDRQITFSIKDYLKKRVSQEEFLLRDGDRVVAVANDRPYAQWLITDTGVWRPDPGGSGLLLRYLPPVLMHGEVWRQSVGNTDIWFRLEKSSSYCRTPNNRPAEGRCWDVTVLNRGERTTFTFAPGLGATNALSVNYASPEDSFDKDTGSVGISTPSAEQRGTILIKAPRPAEKRAAVVPATDVEFWAAIARFPGVTLVKVDLEGDGTTETIVGQLDTWTAAPLDVLDESGRLLGSTRALGYYGYRISLVRFDGDRRTRLLTMTRPDKSTPMVGLTDIRARPNWAQTDTGGWDVKAPWTLADRVKAAPDGTITVEWDMGDPAAHTRIREYRASDIKLLSERFVPTEGAVVYPITAQDVLQAAFVARWMGLSDELPRYFTAPAEAERFAASDAISRPNYTPGTTQFARVAVTDKVQCGLETEPASIGVDGTAPFLATWSGFEWVGLAWGKVTFGTDNQGRPAILTLTIEGDCFSGL